MVSILPFVPRRSDEEPEARFQSTPPREGEEECVFMMIVKNARMAAKARAESAMEKLIDREVKAGRLVDFGGLMPMAQGMQVRLAKGKLDVIDGPFVEAKSSSAAMLSSDLQPRRGAGQCS
jgi:hypothetical protein